MPSGTGPRGTHGPLRTGCRRERAFDEVPRQSRHSVWTAGPRPGTPRQPSQVRWLLSVLTTASSRIRRRVLRRDLKSIGPSCLMALRATVEDLTEHSAWGYQGNSWTTVRVFLMCCRGGVQQVLRLPAQGGLDEESSGGDGEQAGGGTDGLDSRPQCPCFPSW